MILVFFFFQVNTGEEHKLIKRARISGPDDVTSLGYDTVLCFKHMAEQSTV